MAQRVQLRSQGMGCGQPPPPSGTGHIRHVLYILTFFYIYNSFFLSLIKIVLSPGPKHNISHSHPKILGTPVRVDNLACIDYLITKSSSKHRGKLGLIITDISWRS